MAHYSRWIEFLQGDLKQIGWIMGAGSAAGLLLRPWMAQWINRLGAKITWAAGLIVFAIASLGNLLVSDLSVAIYLVRAGLVTGAAIVFASSLTYVSQTAPEHRRTEAIGILGVGGFVGMLIGPYLGDLFLGDIDRQRIDFVWLFVVSAVADLIPLVLLPFLPTPSKIAKGRVGLKEFAKLCKRYWPGPIVLIDFAFGVCMNAPFVFVANFIDDSKVQLGSFSGLGVFFWFYAGVAIFVRVRLRGLPERFGSQRVLVVGCVLMSLGMLCYLLVSAQYSILILVPALMCGTAHGLMFHTMTSMTIESFPTEVRGTGSALALMMLDAGSIIGAPLLGIVGEKWGYNALFVTISLVCLAALLAFMYLDKYGSRPSTGTSE